MFKIYTASDFVYEIEKNISRFKFSLELLVNEEDLLFISKALLKALDRELDVEIIIVSDTDKQSARIYNLINRLMDCGANIYWNNDAEMLSNQSFFLIYDKVNVINKIFYSIEENEEAQVRYMNDIFRSISLESKKIDLPKGNISVDFFSDKVIINKNELVTLSWKVENASFVNIKPYLEEVEQKDTAKVKINKDTLIQLTAYNKNESINKSIFVKVLSPDSEIDINVDVFDPYLKEFISLSPVFENNIEKYSAFRNQKIRISWNILSNQLIKEKDLGTLNSKDQYIFKLNHKKIFLFELINDINAKKEIQIVGVENSEISKLSDEIDDDLITQTNKNNWLKKYINFFKKN
tara:strand:- start:111 stop:1163 length:1053 start_codon:yes stop_codon:yes gene_type:complete